MGGASGSWLLDVGEPDTVAFTGDALAGLIASSVESTVVLESAPMPEREKTQRTFFPPSPPSEPRDPGSISFAPFTFTPPSGVACAAPPPPLRLRAAARAAVALAIGVGIGVLTAVGIGTVHQRATAASAETHVARSASDEKLGIDGPMRDKAEKAKKKRVTAMLPVRPAPPSAPPAPSGLDALGDAQLGRPF